MPTTIAQLAAILQAALTSTADELGRASGFIQRQRKLSGSSFAQTLVFAWLANPQSTMEELSQAAANVGVSVSRQALDERFTKQAAHFMERLLKEVLTAVVRGQRVQTPILARFSAVYLMDATVIHLPAELVAWWGQSAGLKLSLCWDLLQGTWERLHLHPATEHDQCAPLTLATLAKGALLVRDLGYFKLKTFQELGQQGLYWLSRYKVGTAVFIGGERVDVLHWLRDHAPTTMAVDIELGVSERVACRLIAKPVPGDVLRQRQAQLSAWESKKQSQASSQRWNLLGWSLYVTNAPDSLLATAEVETLIRSRWQIEKVFYWWKDDGALDEWRTTNSWRILCEIYAKLLALLIQHWLMISAEIHDVRRSTLQASHTLRKQAWHLAYVLPDFKRLQAVLTHIVWCLRRGCNISTSSTSPPTFQLYYP